MVCAGHATSRMHIHCIELGLHRVGLAVVWPDTIMAVCFVCVCNAHDHHSPCLLEFHCGSCNTDPTSCLVGLVCCIQSCVGRSSRAQQRPGVAECRTSCSQQSDHTFLCNHNAVIKPLWHRQAGGSNARRMAAVRTHCMGGGLPHQSAQHACVRLYAWFLPRYTRGGRQRRQNEKIRIK